MSDFGFQQHDHESCRKDGLARLYAHCQANSLRATPTRVRVLEILLNDHRALGAYEILDHLRQDGLGSQPPVAYRALDFLQEHGFVHRVERLNAFIACTHPEQSHHPTLLICRLCRSVSEIAIDHASSILGQAAETAGFHIEHSMAEAIGLCPGCIKAKQEGLQESPLA